MGKTKSGVDREEKREEILSVARRLFLEEGYESTSMGKLASAVGVSPNTIYWYFADKDALLIAVLDALVLEAMCEYQKKKQAPLDSQLIWLLELLEGAESLIATVHARVPLSEALRTWHEGFHRAMEAILMGELRTRGLAAHELQHASRVAMFVVEGLLAHPTSDKERRGLVRWLVSMVEKTLALPAPEL